jgi:hypothetical protein
LLWFTPKLVARTSELSKECFELQKKIIAEDELPATVIDLQGEVVDLDFRIRRFVAMRNLFPTVLLTYAGFGTLFFIITLVDIPGFIEKTLGVQTPGRLVTLGLAGAFLYLATSTLSRVKASNHPDSQLSGIIAFSIRLLLAVVVPIVLVVLFFDNQGAPRKLSLTPELLSFICGYSSKLVIDIFNKLVEKASKMIDAI